MTVSTSTLKMLAAFVWYGGGIALLIKTVSLLSEAEALRPDEAWTWAAAFGGAAVGIAKARLLFSRSCRKNLARIDALPRPRVWQFYRARFFATLAVVIFLSANLSRHAHGNYTYLVIMATVDLSISIALLASSPVFWRKCPGTTPGPAG